MTVGRPVDERTAERCDLATAQCVSTDGQALARLMPSGSQLKDTLTSNRGRVIVFLQDQQKGHIYFLIFDRDSLAPFPSSGKICRSSAALHFRRTNSPSISLTPLQSRSATLHNLHVFDPTFVQQTMSYVFGEAVSLRIQSPDRACQFS
jgi:hypothetical protein